MRLSLQNIENNPMQSSLPAAGMRHPAKRLAPGRQPSNLISKDIQRAASTRTRSAMMSQEQNDLITRTGAKDPCGKLMRNYWQPAALVDELDGPRPVKPVKPEVKPTKPTPGTGSGSAKILIETDI